MWVKNYSNEIYHHGIKGQRWGVRRFQKKDGTLTNAGKKRYDDGNSNNNNDGNNKTKNPNRKREIAIGVAAAAGSALVVYGAFKVSNAIKDKYFNHYMTVGMQSAKRTLSRGRGDKALANLGKNASRYHNISAVKAVKQTIANNTRNGKVNWKSVGRILT